MALGDHKFGRGERSLAGIYVSGSGPVPSPLMLIGERPGKQDVQASSPSPYLGVSGKEMERFMAAGGLKPSDAYVTFQVKDYNLGLGPEEWEIARDEGLLKSEIEMVEPQIIAAMGRTVVRWFMGENVDLDVVHGIPHWYHHDTLGPIILVPISHPAASFYSPDNQPIILDDFRRLGAVVRGETWPTDQPTGLYLHEPNWINPFHIGDSSTGGTSSRIALDTEGWLHNPWGLSVSRKDGVGLVARKGENMVEILDYHIQEAAAADPNFTVYLHNSLHDLPILDGLGVHVPPECVVDTMVLAYLLCIEPQGLKPLAYRHCGMKMMSYIEVVAPYYKAVFEEWLRTAAEVPNLPENEEEYVLVVDGKVKIKKPWGVAKHLRRILKDADKATALGKEFDYAQRWDNIDDYKKVRVLDSIGEPPEQSLDFVPDEEAIPYSGCDAVATLRIGPILQQKVREQGLETVSRIDHSIIPMIDRMQRVGMLADPDHFDKLAEECTEEMSRLQAKLHSITGAMINPDSGDQTAELLFDQLKLDRKVEFKIKKTEEGDRYSTNDKILEALRFTHDAVPVVCDYREVSKIRSSFCWPISRHARAAKDHRIHPNIRLTRVSSGRLSCTKPNLLAIPVRSKLGKRVREGFIADVGHTLGDWDLDQVEMRYMADESQDAELLRCFRSKIDVHRNTGARVFGKQPADVTGTERYAAKRIGFGVITGITAIGLKAQMDLANATKNGLPLGQGGISWSEDDCDRMIKGYFDVHTGVRDYLDRCRAEARRYGYVRDRWGRIRHLPGVHSSIRHIREEALRQSHSHKIQAGAQGIMKQGMKLVWEAIDQWHREGRWIECLLQVHDELLFELEDDEEFKQEVDFVVVNCLTSAVTLSVPMGAKGGFARNWGLLKD